MTDRERYAASKPCQECGLPMEACNELTLLRLENKRLRAVLKTVCDAYEETEYYDPKILAEARSAYEQRAMPDAAMTEK